MSHRLGTFCAVSDAAADGPARWRLERAGIINIYQYDNEVLDFAGGRLLLRGANGSGKSTAMNMLLPFLLTAKQRNIDAAGEQSRLLHAWMLAGRDDAQPVGYLWIEFRRREEFFTCGCGIRANRQSDRVTTWWFATSQRPCIDFELVVARVPLSADQLRERLGEGAVFREADRPAYRALVARTLFGGAPPEQHFRLIDKVRSPRVGDRVDVDLPNYLMDALPQLSDRALADAAAPLDDLDEHRRNMAETERTVAALGALLERYRGYCRSDLRERATQGRQLLSEARRWRRDETRLRSEAAEAQREFQRLGERIGAVERRAEVLRAETMAIVESSAYREGQQLDAVRDLVETKRRSAVEAQRAVNAAAERVDGFVGGATAAQRRSEGHLDRVNRALVDASRLAGACGLAARPPQGLSLRHGDIDGADAVMPEAVETGESARRLDETSAAIGHRRRDLAAVGAAQGRLDDAEARHGHTQTALDAALELLRQAAERCEESERQLAEAHRDWQASVGQWAADSGMLASPSIPRAPSREQRAALRSEMLAPVEAAVARQHEIAAATAHRRSEAHTAVTEQRSVLDDLISRAAPQPPRLAWQSSDGYCLAEVVDFTTGLQPAAQAGLEAALEASGLLEARPVGDDALELATGELVAVGSRRVDRPLSLLLQVSVPEHLADDVDTRVVARLLDSVSCDAPESANSSEEPVTGMSGAYVGTDGAFAVGSLRGRHAKPQSEHIGAAARQAALARAREAARRELDRLRTEALRFDDLHTEQRQLLDSLQTHRDAFPTSSALDDAELAAASAIAEHDRVDEQRRAAQAEVDSAETAAADAGAELHRVAAQLSLPREHAARNKVSEDLTDLDRLLIAGNEQLRTLEQGVRDWVRTATQLCGALDERSAARERLSRAESEFEQTRARLDRLTASVGATYEKLRNDRDRLETEQRVVEEALPVRRREREAANAMRATKSAEADMAARSLSAAEDRCDAFRHHLGDVLATPGYVGALDDGAMSVVPSAAASGSSGLREVLAGIEQLTAPLEALDARAPDDGSTLDSDADLVLDGASPAAGGRGGTEDDANSVGATVTAQNVRDSLRRRRDSLGAGWDAVDIQDDANLPLRIEVSWPDVGNATLPEAYAAAVSQLKVTTGLLDRKQRDALRELLQGLIAAEIVQKMHGAAHMIGLMNERLSRISTAHRVGVRLRWRRSPDLDPAVSHMVGLLAKPPDVRTVEETDQVRSALAARLAEARADEPDAPYRQLIARTLDYKTWHQLDVMIRRPEADEARLSRRTPLSEGEKKLVTYLPLFVAVAASYDVMAAAAAAPHEEPPGIGRFVLLDDAFAKVSADNHEALFGLLVELDLDFIATSERLWGDHASVPELSIIEIVRDPALRTILLERYSWHGRGLEQVEAA